MNGRKAPFAVIGPLCSLRKGFPEKQPADQDSEDGVCLSQSRDRASRREGEGRDHNAIQTLRPFHQPELTPAFICETAVDLGCEGDQT